MAQIEKEKGKGFLILHLTPSKFASPLVSDSLQVVDVLPNYTLGGFFGTLYHTDQETTSGILLEFNIIPALTRWKGQKGFYLSPIDPLIKPQLIWEQKGSGISLSGRDGFPAYISLKVTPLTPRLPLRFHLPFIETKGEGVIFSKILPITKIVFSSSSIYIPLSSPLSELPFRGKVFSIIFSLGQAVVEEPKAIKGKVLKELKTGVYGRNI